MAVHQQMYSYLIGVNVSHSIAPPMHDFVAKSLGHDWKFKAQECPSLDDAIKLFRAPNFAGGVVTMPYKISIMGRLDGLDETAKLIGACNNVYKTPDGKLRGTNTDWRGVKGCLASGTTSRTGSEGRGRPALLIGAGGAARAAVYALHNELGCKPIYVANRDKEEVKMLMKDTEIYGESCEILHIESLDRARQLCEDRGYPFFIVGTVPDFEPKSESEIAVSTVIEHCLRQASEKGVLLDMCFKPRRTRTIKVAEQYKWTTVEGTDVIGHQISEQYRLWCGIRADSPVTKQIQEGAWVTLKKAAGESKSIN